MPSLSVHYRIQKLRKIKKKFLKFSYSRIQGYKVATFVAFVATTSRLNTWFPLKGFETVLYIYKLYKYHILIICILYKIVHTT